MEKEKKIINWVQNFCTTQSSISKTRVEFVSDRVSYVICLTGRCCNIIVLNAHAPNEEKSDDSKDRFYEQKRAVFFIIFVTTI
jgi:hypothetical protein